MSDPPGSIQLKPFYPFDNKLSSDVDASHDLHGLELVLESFQVCPSDNWAKVGARSHSWNGLLTLALNFNYVRNPREEMQGLLEKSTLR